MRRGVQRRPGAALDNDTPGQPRITCVGAPSLLTTERQVALDRQAQSAAHGRQLVQAEPADFRHTRPQAAKPKGMVVVIGINLGQQPRRAGIRHEQLDHGYPIESGLSKDSRPLASSTIRCSSVMSAWFMVNPSDRAGLPGTGGAQARRGRAGGVSRALRGIDRSRDRARRRRRLNAQHDSAGDGQGTIAVLRPLRAPTSCGSVRQFV